MHTISPEVLDSFIATRKISTSTWVKELEILRRFFRFALRRKWIAGSPAANVEIPKNVKPSDKEPYSRNEIIKNLAACDAIGQRPYERLRARAMTLLLRYTAVRINDVATLANDRIRNGEVYLRTMKNGKVVKLPVPFDLQSALNILPEPIGSEGESKYFLLEWEWNRPFNGARRNPNDGNRVQSIRCKGSACTPIPAYSRD